jgi:hypothetical protein
VNLFALTEDKADEVTYELEHMFDAFRRYHMKLLLADLNTEVRDDVSMPSRGNERFSKIIVKR